MEIADDGVNYSFGNDVMTHTTMQDVCTVARVFVGRHFRASKLKRRITMYLASYLRRQQQVTQLDWVGRTEDVQKKETVSQKERWVSREG